MSDFIFRLHPNIVLGSYTASRLGEFVRPCGSKFMLIMDPILKQVGLSDKITKPLSDRKIDFFIFDEIPEGADTKIVSDALNLARQAHVHGIIGAGGAKVINASRAVASLYYESHDVYDFIDGSSPSTTAPLPLVCVPTTTRSRFIFTDRIPIIDARSSRLRILKAQEGLCRLALFDPNLTVSLTENQSNAMAIETLCIAVEAYISQKSTFFSDMIAEKAIELLGYAMDGSPTLTVTTPQEELLTQGGCMASLAAACSSIGAASLLSLCINARMKLSRSLTTSILFPYILEDAVKFKSDKLAKAARILHCATPESSNDDAALSLVDYVRTRIAKYNLPSRLKELGVTIEQLSLAAEDGGGLDLVNSLQRSMTSDDLFAFIKQAF